MLSEDGKILKENGNLTAFSSKHIRTHKGFLQPLQGKNWVQWDTLPDVVKKSAVNQTRGGQIKESSKGTLNNETVYQLDYVKDGHNNSVRINERGEVYRVRQDNIVSTDFVMPLTQAKTLTWSEIPAAVQQTINAQSGNVESVHKGTLNNETLYEVALTRDGKNGAMRLRENGTVFRQVGAAFTGSPQLDRQTATINGNPQTTDKNPLVKSQPANASNSKVKMTDVPYAAQKTIQTYAAANRVEDIDRVVAAGKVYYEVGYKKNGVHNEITVAEDGTLVRRTENGNVVKEPAGALATPGKTWNEGNAKISFDELPAAVQKTLKAQAGSAQIEDIDRETRSGKTTFEVGFKKNGNHIEIKVLEDGSLVK